MLIECEKCQTKYELADSLFAKGGRKVKCNNCGHVWFQQSVNDEIYKEINETDSSKADVGEDAVDDNIVSFEDDNVDSSEQVNEVEVEAETETENNSDPVEEKEAETSLSMKDVVNKIKHELNEEEVKEDNIKKSAFSKKVEINDTKKSSSGKSILLSFKNIFGRVKAFYNCHINKIFSFASFAILSLITLAVLYSGRNYIVNTMPATYLLYKEAGIEIKVPGEGLEITSLTAQYIKFRDTVNLKINAQISNKSEEDRVFPDLQVVLRNSNKEIVETFYPEVERKRVKAGKAYPFTLEFNDIDNSASMAEIIAIR